MFEQKGWVEATAEVKLTEFDSRSWFNKNPESDLYAVAVVDTMEGKEDLRLYLIFKETIQPGEGEEYSAPFFNWAKQRNILLEAMDTACGRVHVGTGHALVYSKAAYSKKGVTEELMNEIKSALQKEGGGSPLSKDLEDSLNRVIDKSALLCSAAAVV